jgi:stearoyl-CoA desaturase (delta-9 desaturase)
LAKALKDPVISFFSRRFFAINVIFLLVVMLLEPLWLLEILGVAYLIEQIRLGLINTVTHLPSWPGNYINHQHSGTDQSQNNWILGMITLGFAWHNNHHASPAKLILTERWWEIDIEGYVGWLFSLSAKQESKNVDL